MSEEGLQSGDAVQETQAAPAEDQTELQAGSDLATGSDGQHEQKPEVDEAAVRNAATQKVISEKHFQAKQAERERDEALEKVAKFEQEKRDAEAARAGEIPQIPNELDDDFAERTAERDAAIRRQAEFETNQANYQQQQQLQQEQVQQQQQIEHQQRAATYQVRAAELGIDAQELQAAGNAVVSFGVSDELANHIMADADGPLIVKHLAANQADLMTLVSMSSYQQGAYLDQIKAKAADLKPKQTNTPAPPEVLTGSGVNVDTGKYPNSGGATFS